MVACAGLGVLLAWAGLASALHLQLRQNCSGTQYEASGKCCRRCPPGQSVRALCTQEGSETVCVPCPEGQFQPAWTKESGCTPHRYCDPRAGLVQLLQGDARWNVVCRCQDGTHCSGEECQICRKHQPCGPGQGVKQPANHTSDTVCTECPLGFFSNVSSTTATCQQWSSCEARGLLHKADGTRFSDVLCEEAPKARWLPIALATGIVAMGFGGLLLWLQRRRRHCRELQKWQPGQVRPQLEQGPEENEEAFPGLPVEETTPEGGKKSHLAGQEEA